MNCGEVGAHFVPPCFGDQGFFTCDMKKETTVPHDYLSVERSLEDRGEPCGLVRELATMLAALRRGGFHRIKDVPEWEIPWFFEEAEEIIALVRRPTGACE